MIERKALEIASFWAQDVCLDCETIQPDGGEEEDSDEPLTCCSCGSQSMLPAELILQIADMVE